MFFLFRIFESYPRIFQIPHRIPCTDPHCWHVILKCGIVIAFSNKTAWFGKVPLPKRINYYSAFIWVELVGDFLENFIFFLYEKSLFYFLQYSRANAYKNHWANLSLLAHWFNVYKKTIFSLVEVCCQWYVSHFSLLILTDLAC